MPDISTYIKINNKNIEECVEVEDPKSDAIINDSNCRKVTFRYVIVLLAWLAVGIILLYMNLAVRGSCKHDVWNGVEWQIYKDLHGKNYTEDEDEKRICIFLENKKEIEYHNLLFEAGFESYQKEINMFSDFTPEELEELKGFQMSLENSSLLEAFDVRDGIVLPESYDWRSKGAVSGVKNQGNCGSCYAFSATGSLEAQHFLKTGQLVSLSEQNIVDCSMPQGNKGCKGGNMNNAFRYILQNNGIDNEQSYPYEGMEGPCRFQQGGVGATVKGYRTVTPSEGALQAAVVAIGPISIGINVTPNFFKYKTGIFQDDSCDPFSLNHAVLVVGFGSDGIGQDYWILKNSWGTTWGEGGYMRIARNMGNMCGIVTMASYPLV